MAQLDSCTMTKRKRYRDGEYLFRAGDRDFGFFVVKSGSVDILDGASDVPKVIATHGPGEFTGEVAHLTGGVALVSARAREECEVYAVAPEALRQIINLHPQLGDTILQAFIARRQLLRESAEFTGIRLIGSRYSADTSRLRDFLARNRLPFKWLDLEANPDVTLLLRQFGVSEADTPVVTWGRRLLLRNPSDKQLADALGIHRRLNNDVTYDLVIVGAGPAGLGAAVYASSEGLATVVLETTGPGGGAEHAHRELSWLPDRHCGQRTCGPRGSAGKQVRSAHRRANAGHWHDV